MIVDQHMPIKEISKELGVSTDSLRTWLKNAGLNPNSANKDNSQAKRIRVKLFQFTKRNFYKKIFFKIIEL